MTRQNKSRGRIKDRVKEDLKEVKENLKKVMNLIDEKL